MPSVLPAASVRLKRFGIYPQKAHLSLTKSFPGDSEEE